MVWYKRSDYGPNPNAGRLRNNAKERGWGNGWPNCQTAKMVKVTNGDHAVYVRREIAQLVLTLFKVTAKYGYDINPAGQVNQTWGFACRAIRGTNIPSNHSWGLAVDINSLSNPMQSSFKSNIPPKVINAWEVCGFYWGGRYLNRPDAMHLEYIGRPQDVALDYQQAFSMLSPALPPPRPPIQPATPQPNTTIDAGGIRGAARGADQNAEHFADAKQFMAVVRNLQEKLRPKDSPLRNTERAWLNTWYDDPDKARRAALYSYAIRYFQMLHSIEQDGIFGPQSAQALERYGYRVSNE